MSEIILHHYDSSPYSEKIRAIFGFKRLRWQSVRTPMMMPKPDLVALTGGYRRAPVMQIGADIYCDTACIAQELERRFPSPSLFPAGASPWAAIVAGWADAYLFWKAAPYVIAQRVDTLPAGFLADRAAMRGTPPASPEQMKAGLPQIASQLAIALDGLEAGLSRDPYLGGTGPALADFAVYHCLWFVATVSTAKAWLERDYRAIVAWMQRIAALGQGRREEIEASTALALARAAEPLPVEPPPERSRAADPLGLAIGDRVAITAETFGKESVVGEIVALDRERVSVLRRTADLGDIAVHFPRFGYVISRA